MTSMLTNTDRRLDRKGVDCTSTAQLVALWLHGKTPLTQRAYEYDVRCLIAFLNHQSPEQVRLSDGDLRRVTLNDVQAFDDFLLEKGLSDTSRARRLAAIKSLLSFGQKIGYLDFNVGSAVALPKPKDTLAERILTELEVMTMVALTPQGRERLLIQFLYYTGARVGEVAKLTWRDIQPNRDGQGQVTLYGKGQETRTVIIPASLYQGLLGMRGDNNPEAAVFVSRKGKKPLQDRQIRKIVKEAAARAGIAGSVSPHWLRHSHASHSLDRGAAPQLVQKTLGHKSLDTTTRYAHARPSDSSGLYLPT
jgi:integrase/recombinase XerD